MATVPNRGLEDALTHQRGPSQSPFAVSNTTIGVPTFAGTPNAVAPTALAVSEPKVQIDDFYGWLLDQASKLRRSRPDSLDWENLAEELEAMGRSEESALESHLENLLIHLLKWRYQPNKRTGSWEATIENSRERVVRLLDRSPSLKSKIDEAFREAYRTARREAGGQMNLSKREWEGCLPDPCEWNLQTVQDPNFWPDASDAAAT
jgi:uncharacterized protein DUF29